MLFKCPIVTSAFLLLSTVTAAAWTTARTTSSQQQQRFVLNVDQPTLLTTGTLTLPPMCSVPCSFQTIQNSSKDDDNDDDVASSQSQPQKLREMVKPPNVETLYDWYRQVQNQPDADPSWAVLWPTACTLANYLAQNPAITKNKRVVELGCGLGLAGLTAACMQDHAATSVVVTDREPYALHCCMSTAAVNKLSSTIQAAVLDWNDEEMATSIAPADVILASDVLYDKESIDAFVNVCYKLAAAPNALVLVTDPKVERTTGAREMLRKALFGHDNNVEIKIEDLPLASGAAAADASSENTKEEEEFLTATSADGKDHERRMREPTVLISIILPDARSSSPR